MRHDRYWNAYSNINNKQNSTHVLGFNEPNSASQANMTVAQAIAAWPNLMASGLRLGSPAPTDGGLAWLYDFIDQADALNFRVDFVAVHFYKGGWTATQLRDWLSGIHVRTGRPLWVTEFNNGANWTCCTPTLDSNALRIGQFVDVMNQAPYVERYAVYNWVGATRELVTSSGTLNPAGVVYRDKVSPVAYLQELPAGADTSARYLFNGDAIDSTGSGNDGMLVGAPSFAPGHDGTQSAIRLDGVNDYVQLPANLGRSGSFSFGAWVNWDGGASWQRIFDLGDGPTQNLFLTPSSASGTLRFAITTSGGSGEQRLQAPALIPGVWTHVVVTITNSTGNLYVNGILVATGSITNSPAAVRTRYNYLGKSQYPADPLFAGQLEQVFFADYALTDDQVATLFAATPLSF
jgi:hypothetical protein